MKVFVTGSTGFIGKNLVEYYDDTYKGLRGEDLDIELRLYAPDVIIHSAAEIYDHEKMFVPNIAMTYTCLKYVRSNPKVKMIQIGSSSEYGPKSKPSSVTDVLEPIDFYQGTKAAATMMCQGLARQLGLKIYIVRPYSVYGKYERPHRLFPRLWKAFMKGESMKLYQGYHDFIYIDDFIRGIDMVIKNDNLPPGEIFNFGSGIQTSNFELLKKFEDIVGLTAPIEKIDELNKPFESTTWVADMIHTYKTLSYQPQFDLDQGIKDFLIKAMY